MLRVCSSIKNTNEHYSRTFATLAHRNVTSTHTAMDVLLSNMLLLTSVCSATLLHGMLLLIFFCPVECMRPQWRVMLPGDRAVSFHHDSGCGCQGKPICRCRFLSPFQTYLACLQDHPDLTLTFRVSGTETATQALDGFCRLNCVSPEHCQLYHQGTVLGNQLLKQVSRSAGSLGHWRFLTGLMS